MKCPKCAYVGFEPAPRCRHCGYEFSLLSDDPAAANAASAAIAPPPPADLAAPDAVADAPLATTPTPEVDLPLASPAPRMPSLFAETPPPARAPLAVRKTAERPKHRGGAGLARPRPVLVERLYPDAPAAAPDPDADAGTAPGPLLARALALLVDVVLMGATDAAIVYLTMKIAALPMAELSRLPVLPLATFIGGLNLAYFVVFTAHGGQTLGKMLMGVRVEATDGPLTTRDAIVRVVSALLGGLPAGAGWWVALRADRRAAHDHLAHTRVVKVAA